MNGEILIGSSVDGHCMFSLQVYNDCKNLGELCKVYCTHLVTLGTSELGPLPLCKKELTPW